MDVEGAVLSFFGGIVASNKNVTQKQLDAAATVTATAPR